MLNPDTHTERFLQDLAKPDPVIAITRAVAEEIGCPDWMTKSNRCDGEAKDGVCYCRNAAERVVKVHERIVGAQVRGREFA